MFVRLTFHYDDTNGEPCKYIVNIYMATVIIISIIDRKKIILLIATFLVQEYALYSLTATLRCVGFRFELSLLSCFLSPTLLTNELLFVQNWRKSVCLFLFQILLNFYSLLLFICLQLMKIIYTYFNCNCVSQEYLLRALLSNILFSINNDVRFQKRGILGNH